ncbi:hypothetical protein CYLTODRAFT_367307 [Cylindrobasidium torrendii FP15055 ss-10]|uniref:Uncharacterized protein n=1 Tax=Cylindrobasidium torrendii FP15055 ss-10 TaxID=1314674 RepID=A0A0D7BSJ7_9AGAR|nr:hypothetical protein CYLTODRAFT_367307 [Cylindrobasidium torrendii FP15055 ss-10]
MFFATLALFATFALAAPSVELDVRQTNNVQKPTCGVAGDANLSDCYHLYNNWPYYQDATWGATCHSGVNLEYNPACYGNCCIYTSSRTPLWEDVHTAVGHLLDCRSDSKGTVNGRVKVEGSGTVCMADRKACGDCFN